MRNILAIARKELTVYFTTPWAWLAFTAMTFVSSYFFIASLYDFTSAQEIGQARGWDNVPASYRNLTDGVVVQLWGSIAVVTLFIAPFLSMRLFAEERRQKTLELLMTTPLRSAEIVLGKYLGGLGIIGTTLGLTIIYPVILAAFGAPDVKASGGGAQVLEWSTVWLGYLGLLLWGATCMAIGMLLSALTESQALSAILTFAVLLIWMLIRFFSRVVEGAARDLVNYISFDTQLENLMKGVLDLRALVFFGSIIAMMLLLTHRALERQRWTGA